jgi:asparagine synthase (glutamine-hydrolysing)
MCGIAGFVNGEGRPADRSTLERMTVSLAHRGPDGHGVHLDGPAALGHRRLAIIDLAGGAQPLANEDDSVWITYNGELYDEPRLRRELEARGHRYRTVSDTETIVHLYEEHGTGFARLLNGMFALAIWDAPRRRLILARDRMGQKPLHYTRLPGGGLAFASEPKALLEHPEVVRRLDREGLGRYLFYEYLPAPHSIWEGVSKLRPGHLLAFDADTGAVQVERYWAPPAVEPAPGPFEVVAGRFWEEFRASVSRHRRSDVPLGVFLSGGVDSSSVAAALVEVEPAAEVHTFSIGFDDPSFDEGAHFRAVARLLGTDHHERTFSLGSLLELLPEVSGWLDEPFGDASVLPTHLLSRFAREHVTVALGGDGADELLAGYPTFQAEAASRRFGQMPGAARRLAGRLAGALPTDIRNFSLDFKVRQFLRGAGLPPALAHQRWLGSFSGPELDGLLVDGPSRDVEAEQLARAEALPDAPDDLTRSLLLYQDTYLPEDILFKVDRASMACGLEVRAPFLDADLVDALARLPSSFKYHRGQTKRLLKRAAAGRLPDSVLARPKKGFGIPVAEWLRGPLTPLVDEHLGRDRLLSQGLFRPEAVGRLIAEHRQGARNHRKPLWTLLMFQLWADRWL